MVFINVDRMITVTEAKPRLHALIADAHQGRMTHIVKGSEVIAHLVPPTARIIEEEPLMAEFALALLDRETDYLAGEFARTTDFLGHAGDSAGRFFAWAWRTDKHLFMKALAQYHELLSKKVQRRFDANELVELLDRAMTVSLVGSEGDAARQYALSHAADYLYYELP
jgi:antitoxin (DNA-binding transcriptional repressor) of toxin-antitoxin stability system